MGLCFTSGEACTGRSITKLPDLHTLVRRMQRRCKIGRLSKENTSIEVLSDQSQHLLPLAQLSTAGHPNFPVEHAQLCRKNKEISSCQMSLWVCSFPTAASCCKRKTGSKQNLSFSYSRDSRTKAPTSASVLDLHVLPDFVWPFPTCF